MMQRAPLILSSLACLVILGLSTAQRPLRSMMIGAIIVVGLISVMPLFMDLIFMMVNKTMTVGWNNRFEEWVAIGKELTFFGAGWGATWQSPAVGEMHVRYTHNFLSYFMWKAGVIGGVMAFIFIIVWARYILKIGRDNIALCLALLVPFTIHVTLYTGFKTLDFACLLALAVAWCAQNKNQS